MDQGQANRTFLRPRKLVEVLSTKPHLSTTLLHLWQKHNFQPSGVRRVAFTYPRVFHLEEEVVKLRPMVTLCPYYSSNPGSCDLADECQNLHYLHDVCTGDVCYRSHDWDDQPNSRILYNLFLEGVANDVLCKMVQLVMQESEGEARVLPRSGRSSASLWTLYPDGDVPEPEICYDSVEGLCDRESTGCQRLHATRHYQFQVREEGGRWQNLQDSQVDALERSYCDPSQESVQVPPLYPVSYHPSQHILQQLMGQDTWEVQFNTNTLTNSSGEILWLRRLCTEEKEDTEVPARTFIWYFSVEDDIWLPFGTPCEDVKSSVNSEEIESNYKNGDEVMYFATSRSTYTINFVTMTQTNDQSGYQREIRRRPKPHFQHERNTTTLLSPTCHYDESPSSSSNDNDEEPPTTPSPTPRAPSPSNQDSNLETSFPETWEEMGPKEAVRLKSLNPYTSEYKEVAELLEPGLHNRSVMGIKRVQNRQLWSDFQRRCSEMPDKYKGPEPTVRQLFHGTTKDVLSKILKKNLDRTHQGRSYGNKTRYGRGTYFFSNVNRALRHSTPDTADDHCYLLVILVAIGAVTKGDPSMVDPPPDPDDDITFDTTVDDPDGPTVYVKYDKAEYYPQYIVTVM
ncbi:protein mono-ADP-ribosyltransferase PARP12-like [Homarus americanus]|uniref:protein mono-ADP-ribosyltransferase PARP12-like n=1 Tax=Homarus americanus TaxID=6706 RepID=UPI001C4883E8|nr:protein mono-ADP-ribosyltransferase PARP12-like [Homarus americanus]XP_042226973.1 protein mono-ADP-ribosyltransferase PARP12-like [Homarus americanus]XP_042226974.1 protein mono-ADP-ribosyltransferase PARP12-like [Homarus americanus]